MYTALWGLVNLELGAAAVAWQGPIHFLSIFHYTTLIQTGFIAFQIIRGAKPGARARKKIPQYVIVTIWGSAIRDNDPATPYTCLTLHED